MINNRCNTLDIVSQLLHSPTQAVHDCFQVLENPIAEAFLPHLVPYHNGVEFRGIG